MADNSPPAMMRHAIWGHAGGAKKAPQASIPRINVGLLERGESQRGGEERSAGGGGHLTDAGGMEAFNDPVVSGMGYDRKTGGSGLLGALTAGQSRSGDQQQALHERYQTAMQMYNQALDGGATQQQALTQVVRADPGFLSDVLVSHPAALKAFQSASDIHDFMAGKAAPDVMGGVTKGPNGEMLQEIKGPDGRIRVEPVEGAPTPTPKTAPAHWSTGPNGEVQASSVGPDGKITTQTATNADGTPTTVKPAGKAPPGTYLGLGGVPQLSPNNRPTGGEDRITMNQLETMPTVMREMKTLMDNANVAGLVSGPIKIVGGQYIGTQGQAINFKAALDAIDRALPAAQGTNYKASLEAARKAIADPNEAPTFLKQQIPTVLNDMRTELQAKADVETQRRGAALPPGTAAPLMKDAGVVPNGYVDEAEMRKYGMTDAQIGLFKMQNPEYKSTLTDNDRIAVQGALVRGDYGPLPQPGKPGNQQILTPNAQVALGDLADVRQQQAAQKTQGAAGQTAAGAAPPPRPPQGRDPETPQAPPQPAPGAGMPPQGQPTTGGGVPQTQADNTPTAQPVSDQQPQPQQPQQQPVGAAAAPGATTMTPQAVPAPPSAPAQTQAQANAPAWQKPQWVNTLEQAAQQSAQPPQPSPDQSPYIPPMGE